MDRDGQERERVISSAIVIEEIEIVPQESCMIMYYNSGKFTPARYKILK